MAEKVDARGLSCPQPVLLTLAKIKALGRGDLEVLVNNETSKENVSRAASGQGWSVTDVLEENNEFTLKLTKR